MAWNPIVKAARRGETFARQRRFHNKAVTDEATLGETIINNSGESDLSSLPSDAIIVTWVDAAALDVAMTIGPPAFLGQLVTVSLNKTTGGKLTLSMTRTIQSGGSLYGTVTMSNAGSVIMMQGYRYNDQDHWLSVASHGCSFS